MHLIKVIFLATIQGIHFPVSIDFIIIDLLFHNFEKETSNYSALWNGKWL